MTMKVERVTGGAATVVPTRIFSSGGGVDLRTHNVSVDLEIREVDALRKSKLRQLAELFFLAREKNPSFPSLDKERYIAQTIPSLEDMYVYLPPGRYRIISRYDGTSPKIWPSVLESEPLLVDVTDAGDSLEQLKREMRAQPRK